MIFLQFWAAGEITDEEFLDAISFLIDAGVLKIDLIELLIEENEKLKQ